MGERSQALAPMLGPSQADSHAPQPRKARPAAAAARATGDLSENPPPQVH